LNSHDHLVIIGANTEVRFHSTASAVAELSVSKEYDKEKKIWFSFSSFFSSVFSSFFHPVGARAHFTTFAKVSQACFQADSSNLKV
jgi:hypothetical protein